MMPHCKLRDLSPYTIGHTNHTALTVYMYTSLGKDKNLHRYLINDMDYLKHAYYCGTIIFIYVAGWNCIVSIAGEDLFYRHIVAQSIRLNAGLRTNITLRTDEQFSVTSQLKSSKGINWKLH